MTSPRLQQIQRQLSRGAASSTPVVNNDSSMFMEAVEEAVTRKAEARIQAANEQRDKAEAETAKVRDQLAKVQKELMQVREVFNHRVEGMHKESKQEMEKMHKQHKEEAQRMKDEMMSLRRELAEECEAKARAEARLEEAGKMQAHLEKMLAAPKVATPPPIVQTIPPVAAPMKGATIAVSKRDENGRIVSMTITPQT